MRIAAWGSASASGWFWWPSFWFSSSSGWRLDFELRLRGAKPWRMPAWRSRRQQTRGEEYHPRIATEFRGRAVGWRRRPGPGYVAGTVWCRFAVGRRPSVPRWGGSGRPARSPGLRPPLPGASSGCLPPRATSHSRSSGRPPVQGPPAFGGRLPLRPKRSASGLAGLRSSRPPNANQLAPGIPEVVPFCSALVVPFYSALDRPSPNREASGPWGRQAGVLLGSRERRPQDWP